MISYKQKSEKLKMEFNGYDFNMNNLTCAVIALLEEVSMKLDKLDDISAKLDNCNCDKLVEESIEKKGTASKEKK